MKVTPIVKPSISLRVVSKRAGGRAPVVGETVIDIDRSHPVFGNPFVLRDHRDDLERARVIAAYTARLDADIERNGPMARAVAALGDRVEAGEAIALRCWCAPKPCHGDVIRDRVLARLGLVVDAAPVSSVPQQLDLLGGAGTRDEEPMRVRRFRR